MALAIYQDKPTSLGSLGNWLVHMPNENPINPPPRINRSQVSKLIYIKGSFKLLRLYDIYNNILSPIQRCQHHTVIVLDRKPKSWVINEYMHDLTHANGQVNKPDYEMMKNDQESKVQNN